MSKKRLNRKKEFKHQYKKRMYSNRQYYDNDSYIEYNNQVKLTSTSSFNLGKTNSGTTQIFDSIESLVQKLKQDEQETGEKYYYRGQLHDWPIQSSASRIQFDEVEMKKTGRLINWLLNNKSLGLDKDSQIDINKCWAIAQHYGYKTDFIDFTTDCEVAAFFATDGISAHPEFIDDYGVLWRISEKELLRIQSMMDVIMDFLIEENPDRMDFKQNISCMKKYKAFPFISINIPQMSRVNNQSGLFLWDLSKIVTNYYFNDREPDFKFKQTGEVFSSDRVDSTVIYPKPNALEMEIERFGSIEDSYNFFHSDLYDTIEHKISITRLDSNFSRFLGDYDWPDKFGKLSNDFEKTMVKIDEVCISSDEQLRQLIIDNRELISEGNRKFGKMMEFAEPALDNLLDKIISRLIYFPYTDDEIFLVVQSIIKNYRKSKNEGIVTDFEGFCNQFNRQCFQEKIYNKDMLKVGMVDFNGVSSYAFIPFEIIGNVLSSKRKIIQEKLSEESNVELEKLLNSYHDWDLFLDLNHYPRMLFDFVTFKKIFVDYILPYQFIVRPESYRIYNPIFLQVFGPE